MTIIANDVICTIDLLIKQFSFYDDSIRFDSIFPVMIEFNDEILSHLNSLSLQSNGSQSNGYRRILSFRQSTERSDEESSIFRGSSCARYESNQFQNDSNGYSNLFQWFIIRQVRLIHHQFQ